MSNDPDKSTNTSMIPIGAIRIDHASNFSRGGVTPSTQIVAVRRLVESFQAGDRMLEPIGIRDLASPVPRPEADVAADPTGPREYIYEVVYGYRRHYAAASLGWRELPCVLLGAIPDKTARRFNIIENAIRAPKSDYDDAMVYAMLLREGNLTPTELAKQLHTNASRLEHLVRIVTRCPKEVLEIWHSGPSEANYRALMTISMIESNSEFETHRLMIKAFEVARGVSDDPNEGERQGRPRSARRTRAMSQRVIEKYRWKLDLATEVFVGSWRPLSEAERAALYAVLSHVAYPHQSLNPLRRA